MVITEQIRSITSRRDRFLLTTAGPSVAQTPGPARPGAPALIRRLRHVNQRVTVPYWIVALMLVAVVASSMAAMGTVRAAPAPAAGPAPIVRTLTIPDGEGLNAGGSAIAPAATTDQSLVQLQQAIAALSANLERTQRDNAALRDQQRQQAQDLAQAVDGTVLSQQQRSGEVRDTEAHGQQQEQQLHGQYQGLTQGVAGQLSSLQQKAAAAAQVANRLRAALGLS